MLKPKKRLIRREIKEDPLVTKYIQVQKLAQTYSKQINIGLIAIAVIIVVSIFMVRSKRNAEMAASSQLGLAETFFYAKNYDRALQELQVIVDTFPGTKAAGQAVYFVANIYFDQQNYADAERYFLIYTEDYSDHVLITGSSYAGIAACMETNKNYDEAAQYYIKAADKDDDSFQTPYYLQSAGRSKVMAGNPVQGKEIYQSILDKYPDATNIEDIKLSLGAL